MDNDIDKRAKVIKDRNARRQKKHYDLARSYGYGAVASSILAQRSRINITKQAEKDGKISKK